MGRFEVLCAPVLWTPHRRHRQAKLSITDVTDKLYYPSQASPTSYIIHHRRHRQAKLSITDVTDKLNYPSQASPTS
jgi:hypothetical protein